MLSNFDYYNGWKKDYNGCDWNKGQNECDNKKDYYECDYKKDYYECDWKKDHNKCDWKKDHHECDWKKDHDECDWKKDHHECDWKKDHHECDYKKDSNHKKGNFARLCARFADILESEPLPSPRGVCVVTRMRDIDVKIKGRPTRSPLVLNALFSFESPDKEGRTLNLGETVILQEEINPFIKALRALGIKVTALHNHWLFENPRLFYIHFLSVDEPLTFAKKVARAFRILENCE